MALRIGRIVWDGQNIEHIARHRVTPNEVEEVLRSSRRFVRRIGERRYSVYGQAGDGRYLVIILDQEARSSVYPVTARPMTPNERRAYRHQP